jgi:uncharacterized protein YegL
MPSGLPRKNGAGKTPRAAEPRGPTPALASECIAALRDSAERRPEAAPGEGVWSDEVRAAVTADPHARALGQVVLDLSMSLEKKFPAITEALGRVRSKLADDTVTAKRLVASLAWVNDPPVVTPFCHVTEQALWTTRMGNSSPIYRTVRAALTRTTASRNAFDRAGVEMRRNVVYVLTDGDVNIEDPAEREANARAVIDLQRDDPELELFVLVHGERANFDAVAELSLNPERVMDARDWEVEKLVATVLASLIYVSQSTYGQRIDLREMAEKYGIDRILAD